MLAIKYYWDNQYSSRIKWSEHVACMGEIKNVYKVWPENLKGREHLEDLKSQV
jgi:hypothetical protein